MTPTKASARMRPELRELVRDLEFGLELVGAVTAKGIRIV